MSYEPYFFETDRLLIQTSNMELAPKMLKYYSDNREFFDKYEPVHSDRYFTLEMQTRMMEQEVHNMEYLSSAYYYFSLKEDPDKIIGSISFVRIRPEPYASVIFGYNLHEEYQGHGYCTEACAASIEHVLSIAHIHRIESRVLTDNIKSIHVLERLGFFHEGFEKASILIGGRFRDHERYAYLNEDY